MSLREKWLDEVSVYLSLVEEGVSKLDPEEFESSWVDYGARVRLLKNKLEGIDKELSKKIFPNVFPNQPEVGKSFTVHLQVSERTCLKIEEIKSFLGKRLPRYQYTQQVESLIYKPKA